MYPLTSRDESYTYKFKVQPRPCGKSRRAMRLWFKLADDGTMIDPTVADTGP